MPVVSKTFIPAAKKKRWKTREAGDVAARYFVYKLYDALRSNPGVWQPVRPFRETAETVSRAVELGLVVIRDEGTGRAKQACAALTEEGRLMARKGLR